MPTGFYIRSKEHEEKRINALREAIKGKCLSEETKKKIGDANKGKLKGRKLSGETKKKMSKNASRQWLGKKLSKEHCRKISGALNGRRLSEETKQKMKGRISWNKGREFYQIKGEKHPRWVKDRNKLIKNVEKHERNNKEYYHWRWLILKRDEHICRINNKDCKGRVIAHHILSWRDFPELRYEVNNGITLCQAHHPRKRAEEKRLIPFLQGLVPVSEV